MSSLKNHKSLAYRSKQQKEIDKLKYLLADNLRADMKRMFDTSCYSDITFSIEGDKYPVHKLMLQARVPEFWDFFVPENWTQGQTVVLESIRSSDFQQFLGLVYTADDLKWCRRQIRQWTSLSRGEEFFQVDATVTSASKSIEVITDDGDIGSSTSLNNSATGYATCKSDSSSDNVLLSALGDSKQTSNLSNMSVSSSRHGSTSVDENTLDNQPDAISKCNSANDNFLLSAGTICINSSSDFHGEFTEDSPCELSRDTNKLITNHQEADIHDIATVHNRSLKQHNRGESGDAINEYSKLCGKEWKQISNEVDPKRGLCSETDTLAFPSQLAPIQQPESIYNRFFDSMEDILAADDDQRLSDKLIDSSIDGFCPTVHARHVETPIYADNTHVIQILGADGSTFENVRTADIFHYGSSDETYSTDTLNAINASAIFDDITRDDSGYTAAGDHATANSMHGPIRSEYCDDNDCQSVELDRITLQIDDKYIEGECLTGPCSVNVDSGVACYTTAFDTTEAGEVEVQNPLKVGINPRNSSEGFDEARKFNDAHSGYLMSPRRDSDGVSGNIGMHDQQNGPNRLKYPDEMDLSKIDPSTNADSSNWLHDNLCSEVYSEGGYIVSSKEAVDNDEPIVFDHGVKSQGDPTRYAQECAKTVTYVDELPTGLSTLLRRTNSLESNDTYILEVGKDEQTEDVDCTLEDKESVFKVQGITFCDSNQGLEISDLDSLDSCSHSRNHSSITPEKLFCGTCIDRDSTPQTQAMLDIREYDEATFDEIQSCVDHPSFKQPIITYDIPSNANERNRVYSLRGSLTAMESDPLDMDATREISTPPRLSPVKRNIERRRTVGIYPGQLQAMFQGLKRNPEEFDNGSYGYTNHKVTPWSRHGSSNGRDVVGTEAAVDLGDACVDSFPMACNNPTFTSSSGCYENSSAVSCSMLNSPKRNFSNQQTDVGSPTGFYGGDAYHPYSSECSQIRSKPVASSFVPSTDVMSTQQLMTQHMLVTQQMIQQQMIVSQAMMSRLMGPPHTGDFPMQKFHDGSPVTSFDDYDDRSSSIVESEILDAELFKDYNEFDDDPTRENVPTPTEVEKYYSSIENLETSPVEVATDDEIDQRVLDESDDGGYVGLPLKKIDPVTFFVDLGPVRRQHDAAGSVPDDRAIVKLLDGSPRCVKPNTQSRLEYKEEKTAFKTSSTFCKLGSDLLDIYVSGTMSDCVLVAGGCEMPCHRSILSSRSSYLSERLSASAELDLGLSPEHARFLVRFIYAGFCEPPKLVTAEDLVRMADQFAMEGLRELAIYKIRKELLDFFHNPCPGCIRTFPDALRLSQSLNLSPLRTMILKWFVKHHIKLMACHSFSQMAPEHQELCYEHVYSAVTADNVIAALLDCEKLFSALPKTRWAAPLKDIAQRYLNHCIELIGAKFGQFVRGDEFYTIVHGGTWTDTVVDRLCQHIKKTIGVDTVVNVTLSLHHMRKSKDMSDWTEVKEDAVYIDDLALKRVTKAPVLTSSLRGPNKRDGIGKTAREPTKRRSFHTSLSRQSGATKHKVVESAKRTTANVARQNTVVTTRKSSKSSSDLDLSKTRAQDIAARETPSDEVGNFESDKENSANECSTRNTGESSTRNTDMSVSPVIITGAGPTGVGSTRCVEDIKCDIFELHSNYTPVLCISNDGDPNIIEVCDIKRDGDGSSDVTELKPVSCPLDDCITSAVGSPEIPESADRKIVVDSQRAELPSSLSGEAPKEAGRPVLSVGVSPSERCSSAKSHSNLESSSLLSRSLKGTSRATPRPVSVPLPLRKKNTPMKKPSGKTVTGNVKPSVCSIKRSKIDETNRIPVRVVHQ